MYSINNLPMNVLITSDEVLRFFPGNSIDPNLFTSAIYMTEQRFIIPLLGYDFYTQFCAQKNVLVTSSNIVTLQAYFTSRNITLQEGDIVNAIDLVTVTTQNALLWNSVLWPFLAECVKFTAMPSNYVKFTTAGMVKNNPNPAFLDGNASGNSSGASLRDLQYLRDNVLLQNINVMQESLERFLYANKASFPLVPSCVYDKWDCNGNKKEDTRRTGLVFIYDDEDDCDSRGGYCGSTSTPAPTPAPIPQTRSCTLILEIVDTPDPTHLYLLCNLQNIPLEYPVGNTLTVPHLIGLIVNTVIQIDNGAPFVCPYNAATGTFDNTSGGGFVSGNTVIINYNELI